MSDHPEIQPDTSIRIDPTVKDDHVSSGYAQADNRPIKHGAMLPQDKRLVFGSCAHPNQLVASNGRMENRQAALTQHEIDRADLTGTSISINHGKGKARGRYAENGEVLASVRGDDGSIYTLNAMNRDNSVFGEDTREVEDVMNGIKTGRINKVSLRVDSKFNPRTGQITKRVFPELSVMDKIDPAFPQCDIFTDYHKFPPDVQKKLMAKLLSKYTPAQLAELGITVPAHKPDTIHTDTEFRDIVMCYAEHTPDPTEFKFCTIESEDQSDTFKEIVAAYTAAQEQSSDSKAAPQKCKWSRKM